MKKLLMLGVLVMIAPVLLFMTGCRNNNNNGGGTTSPAVGTYEFSHFLINGEISTLTDFVETIADFLFDSMLAFVDEIIDMMDDETYTQTEEEASELGYDSVREMFISMMGFDREEIIDEIKEDFGAFADGVLYFNGYEARITYEEPGQGEEEMVFVFEYVDGSFNLVRIYEGGEELDEEELKYFSDDLTFVNGNFIFGAMDLDMLPFDLKLVFTAA